MKSLPLTSELRAVAQRVGFFEEPQSVIATPVRLVAYAMTHGDHADMKLLRKYLSDDDLREALANAPPGIFDPRSWAYWNLKLDRYPAPSMTDKFFDMSNPRRTGTVGEFDRGFDENGFPR